MHSHACQQGHLCTCCPLGGYCMVLCKPGNSTLLILLVAVSPGKMPLSLCGSRSELCSDSHVVLAWSQKQKIGLRSDGSTACRGREAQSGCAPKHPIEALGLHEACLPKSVLCLFCYERDSKQRARRYRSIHGEFLGVTRSCPV